MGWDGSYPSGIFEHAAHGGKSASVQGNGLAAVRCPLHSCCGNITHMSAKKLIVKCRKLYSQGLRVFSACQLTPEEDGHCLQALVACSLRHHLKYAR